MIKDANLVHFPRYKRSRGQINRLFSWVVSSHGWNMDERRVLVTSRSAGFALSLSREFGPMKPKIIMRLHRLSVLPRVRLQPC